MNFDASQKQTTCDHESGLQARPLHRRLDEVSKGRAFRPMLGCFQKEGLRARAPAGWRGWRAVSAIRPTHLRAEPGKINGLGHDERERQIAAR
jgi:hypothetical protein